MNHDQILSWALTYVGLIGFWLAGKKLWWAWYINIANQVLWAVFAIVTDYYAFLIGSAFYLFVFGRNAIKWTREHFSASERFLRGFDPDRNAVALPPLHHGYKAQDDYDGPWPPVPPKGPGGGSHPFGPPPIATLSPDFVNGGCYIMTDKGPVKSEGQVVGKSVDPELYKIIADTYNSDENITHLEFQLPDLRPSIHRHFFKLVRPGQYLWEYEWVCECGDRQWADMFQFRAQMLNVECPVPAPQKRIPNFLAS